MDAIALLMNDHRNVDQLFERYQQTRTVPEKRQLVEKIIAELTPHAEAEEKELYPEAREALPDAVSLVEDALREHAEAKQMMSELASGDPGTIQYDVKVAALARMVRHHVGEEEQKLFPKLREHLSRDRLDALGGRLEKAKAAAPKRPARPNVQKPPTVVIAEAAAAAVDRVRGAIGSAAKAVLSGARTKARARGGRSRTREAAGKQGRRRSTTGAKTARSRRRRAGTAGKTARPRPTSAGKTARSRRRSTRASVTRKTPRPKTRPRRRAAGQRRKR